ncbi:MAG TPA: DUF423 domain-containing protein [Planctomycetes bacterium]|nr:DUF423 domain-containing protein [Planctomycetota bacterium]
MSETQSENAGRAWILFAATLGFLSVLTGAFGAHGLKGHLHETLEAAKAAERLAVWETACRYAAYHALALLALGALAPRLSAKAQRIAGWSFLSGTLVFSGTLWLLVLSGKTWLGAITPLGGTALLVGWVALGLSARGPGGGAAVTPVGG